MLLNEEKAFESIPEGSVFALDIGTRTIIGLVGVQKNNGFLVKAAEIIEHESRAMVDGQIHDIEKVVCGVKKVKEALENKLGYKLTRVSIAAAGRVLKTCRVIVSRDIEEGQEIDEQFVSALELEGIHKAQQEIDSDSSNKEREQYYCVGYSVVHYFLNDYVITNLTGHKGNRAGAEILATFLPQTVVDSLHTVIARAGMQVDYMTLEPIAALNLAIPQELRLLNLALVDIGAGTSDIAITRSGTVVAYSMVPMAGDEITECIAQHYLVDFNTAEKIKITINTNDSVVFKDILDNEICATAEEVHEIISPVIDKLAKTIAEKIIEYNGDKAPNAVFLVGGGSMTKGLCPAISKLIGLPDSRVAVRNRSMAKNIELQEDKLNGPDGITPLGIIVTAVMANGQDFYSVKVNGSKVRIYNSRKMTVSDALILADIKPEELLCKSGNNLKFYVDGKERIVRGGFGKPAEIYVNNEKSRLNSSISPGDDIIVIPAENGADGKAVAADLLEDIEPVTLVVNQITHKVYPRIYINGKEVLPETPVKEGDKVEIIKAYTLDKLSKIFNIDLQHYNFTVNGEPYGGKTIIGPGDYVEANFSSADRFKEEKQEEKEKEEQEKEIEIETEKEKEKDEDTVAKPGKDDVPDIKTLLKEVEHNLAKRDGITVKVNGELITIPPKNTEYLFIDVFNYIDFDITVPRGIIQLRINGKKANYTDIIKSGDLIDIYWED